MAAACQAVESKAVVEMLEWLAWKRTVESWANVGPVPVAWVKMSETALLRVLMAAAVFKQENGHYTFLGGKSKANASCSKCPL